MFKTRLLSGIVLVIVLALVIGFGGNVLFAFTLVISLIGMYELNKVVKVENKLPGVVALLGGVLYYSSLFFKVESLKLASLVLALILMMAVYVFSFPKFEANQIITSYFGLIYVAVMISYIYQARMLKSGAEGVALAVLIFISSWGSDTCAYCVGMLLGKRKLAPILSPKKSVEGGIGGVLGAALLGCLFAFILNKTGNGSHSLLLYALICGVGAVISMIGDLAASAIKRNHEIKDYGTLIPGHGGILDRFDSVIFTAPIIYYMALYLL
ncbi:MAG TPA: phosphatidate cytidylyltransferase [Candidatus Dorea intestinavium]|nr:phosphatidate cytidylyltransferase [Candidatus Dorea intestinavium]